MEALKCAQEGKDIDEAKSSRPYILLQQFYVKRYNQKVAGLEARTLPEGIYS